MAKKNQGPGIQSAAGLIRYYDSDEQSNVKIAPSVVLVISVIVGILTVAMHMFWEY